MKDTTETQVQLLFNTLMTGIKVDRVFAWQQLRIADLRSRICNVEKQFGVIVERHTKPSKRYKEYFLLSKPNL